MKKFNLLGFDDFITPKTIEIVWMGIIVLTIFSGIIIFISKIIKKEFLIAILTIIGVLLILFLCRISFEMIILLFKIYERLCELKNK